MLKFLKSIILFSFLVIILAGLIDIAFSKELRKSCKFAGEYEVWNDIYGGNLDNDIAIYGSSRAWTHFNPMIIERETEKTVYNFGIDGHNFWLQYLRHLEYLKYNKQPEYIVLSIDVFSLQKREDLFNYNQFLPYMLWNKDIYKYTLSYKGFRHLDHFIPLVRYYGKKRAKEIILNSNSKDCTEPTRQKGFRGQKMSWSSDFEKAQKKSNFYKAKMDNASIALFERFIDECQNMGVKLILVYSPEYIEGQKYMINREEIINIFKDKSKKYSIPFLDYSKDTICMDKQFFFNATHLNEKGAELFTKKFVKDFNMKIKN